MKKNFAILLGCVVTLEAFLAGFPHVGVIVAIATPLVIMGVIR